jgi:hypothetical protein
LGLHPSTAEAVDVVVDVDVDVVVNDHVAVNVNAPTVDVECARPSLGEEEAMT